MLSVVLRCFPSWWRDRYEQEFMAMFDNVRFSCSVCVDVLKLAMEVRMNALSGLSAWKIVFALSLTGALVGAGAAVVWPGTYQSSAVIRIDARDVSTGELVKSALSNAALERVIQASGVTADQSIDAPERIARFRRHLNLAAVGNDHNAILVQYLASKPEIAQRVTAALVDALRGALPRSYPVELIDPASLDQDPISPNVRNIIVAGVLAGALCGLIVAGLTTNIRRHPPMRPV